MRAKLIFLRQQPDKKNSVRNPGLPHADLANMRRLMFAAESALKQDVHHHHAVQR